MSFCKSILLLFVVVGLGGCDSGPPVGTVTGEALYDGKPIQDGRIEFKPVDGKGAMSGAPIVDGKFTAVGVPVGKMKVELHGNQRTGKMIKAYDTPESPSSPEVVELLPHKYHVTSEIVIDVKRGNNTERFDLKK
jgi:hypothetical protein